MPHWVFYIYGWSVEGVNARVRKRGVALRSREEKEVNQLLFTNDAVLENDSEEKLSSLVREFEKRES